MVFVGHLDPTLSVVARADILPLRGSRRKKGSFMVLIMYLKGKAPRIRRAVHRAADIMAKNEKK
jgi:hypothetical protein